ncbi:MAG: hypothetical protein WCC36_14425, partial [Gammaproteobacteria bacterium]
AATVHHDVQAVSAKVPALPVVHLSPPSAGDADPVAASRDPQGPHEPVSRAPGSVDAGTQQVSTRASGTTAPGAPPDRTGATSVGSTDPAGIW